MGPRFPCTGQQCHEEDLRQVLGGHSCFDLMPDDPAALSRSGMDQAEKMGVKAQEKIVE